MVEVYKIREKKNKIGFMVRTRDACDVSRRVLPALLSEPNIDVYWIDGSVTDEGIAQVRNDYRDLPGLCEAHEGINFGQVKAWIYGIRQLLSHDYEYLGMLDGDVLLHPGWLQAMLALYEKGERDGLHVGTVSARCIADRILVPRDGYAVMGNIGGGMVIVRRDVFLKVMFDESNVIMDNPTFKFSEIYATFKELADVEYPIGNQLRKDLAGREIKPNHLYEWHMSNDWWWEVILLRQGMVALAPTPSYAENIDEDGRQYVVQTVPTISDPSFDWQGFAARLQKLYENPIIKLAPQFQAMLQTGT